MTFDNLKYVISDFSFIRRREPSAPAEDSAVEKEKEEAYRRAADRAERVGRVLRTLATRMTKRIVAGAPVRSQPRRLYEPVEEVYGSEGTDIPLFLNRMKATNPVEWERIKEVLDRFGHASGLFDDITIRRLGKSASDPFQVIVKVSGPAANLIDVGYGVSQILPLVTDLVRDNRPKIFLFQQPEVHLHPSAQAELGSLLATTAGTKRHTIVVETHSDFIIDRVRMDIRDKNGISPSDALILFFEHDGVEATVHEIAFEANGQLANAPPGYREFFIREQLRSLQDGG